MSEIRIGIVGAGANTVAQHIPRLQAIEGCTIVSVSNRSRASAERVAQQFGIPTVYERWQDLITAPDTDAIVVGTWPYLHCPAVLAALAAGKHVLCEARMALDAAEAHAMSMVASLHPQLVTQVVPSPVTLRVDRTVQRLIAEGYLGDLLAIEVRDGNAFLDREAPLHWRQNRDLSGVNILTLGIWYEALMRWVGEAHRVMAMGRIFTPMRRDADGIQRAVRVPEHVDIIADMACGAQAHLRFSSVTGHAGPGEIWLFGSAGTLRFSAGALWGGRRGDPALEEIAIPAAEAGRWRVEEEFIGAIRGSEPVTHTPFATGVKYMEFTEAVARSIATGGAVVLPLALNGAA
jgi:predicted dehydrogenase